MVFSGEKAKKLRGSQLMEKTRERISDMQMQQGTSTGHYISAVNTLHMHHCEAAIPEVK
jgi:hypothetical protein